MELDTLLNQFAERNASDLHLAVGVPPIFRINGALVPGDEPSLTPEDLDALLQTALPEDKLDAARQGHDFSATLRHAGQTFRCQVFRERGCLSAAIRILPDRIPTLAELQLPPVFETLTQCKRGLILIAGPTGSGKATTLLSMLDHINRTRSERILTIENPLEFALASKLSFVTQRAVGEDVESQEQGLRSALVSDPDVIYAGTLRTPEAVRLAIEAANVGHLVFTQMTAETVADALTRFCALLPPPRRALRAQLAQCLQAVIAQKLLPADEEYRDKTGRGRVPVNEVLIATAHVRQMIAAGQTDLTLVMEASLPNGMQTMNGAVREQYHLGRISRETMEHHLTETGRQPPG